MATEKVKIFKLIDGTDNLEDLINDWIALHPTYQVQNIAIAIGRKHLENTERDVIILYKEVGML